MALEDPEATRVASLFHPAWDRLSQGAKKLHARNVHQVAGRELDQASDMIICWTPGGRGEGGTGQVIRIANYLEIPVFDLAVVEDKTLLDFINQE